MATKKYLSLDRLTEYDALIKEEITSGDESTLSEAKSYADTATTALKNELLNGTGEAYDTLKELGDLIDENVDAIEALESVATGKADKEHTHVVGNITDITATATELNYMGGVTSNVQIQLNTIKDDAKTFIVTINGNETDGYTADKTHEETLAAYNNGKSLYCYNVEEDKIGVLYRASSEEICWLTVYYEHQIRYDLLSDNTVNVYTLDWKPATHAFRHAKDGSDPIAPDDIGAISKNCIHKETGDIADLYETESCRYIIGNEVTGMPINGEWWYADVLSNGNTDMTIIAYKVSSDNPDIYVKICSNSVWSDWREVVTADSGGHIRTTGIVASDYLTVANAETSMGLYVNGLGSNTGNVWIDESGEAWLGKVYVGSDDNYKELATQEYVDEHSVQPDWSQYDTSANDYVKNRTHYHDVIIKELFPEQTVETTLIEGSDTIASCEISQTIERKESYDTYIVTFDGMTYECEAWSGEDHEYIGNGDLVGENGHGNSEPFVMYFMHSLDQYPTLDGVTTVLSIYAFVTVNSAGSHTISISGKNETLIKLDQKYLPDTVATKTYVEDMVANALPSATAADNGKFLRVVNGAPAWATVQNIEEVEM